MTVTNVTPPVVSGTAREGQQLTTSAGTWTSDDPLEYDYAWRRCDALGASCVTIGGATDNRYTLTASDVGATIRARVTVTEITPTPASDLLRFTPPGYPSFTGYTTVNLSNSGSNRFWQGNSGVNYVIVIDDYEYTEGPSIIPNGGNVVITGGTITINDSSDPDPFGLALWPRNGAKIYVEGVRITPGASDLHLHDGIVVRHNGTYPSNSSSRIVLQNLRVGPCSIRPDLTSALHSDIIQFQSEYPGQIWVDRFTGLGDYNGLMYSNFTVPLSDYHRMNLRGDDVHATYSWNLGIYQGIAASKIQFDDFYIEPGPGKTLSNCMYPAVAGRTAGPSDSVSAATVGTDGIGDYLSWANTASGLIGKMREGPPAGGDFCEEADCGTGYTTPGYL